MEDKTAPVTGANVAPSYSDTSTITLTPVDPASGVASTHWRLDSGEWHTGTSVPVPHDELGAHLLEWYSTDIAGNIEADKSASFDVVTRYDDTVEGLGYSGTWFAATHPTNFIEGSIRTARNTGTGVTFEFTGTGYDWIAAKGPSYGIASVTLDDGDPEPVDLYNSAFVYKTKAWGARDLADTTHTVTIEFTGDKNPSSTGTQILLDAIDVIGTMTQ